MYSNSSQSGQTLIEVLIALTVGVLILGALVIATVVSIRNAQFSQNQLQASKFAAEGVDLVRTIRNRNLRVESADPTLNTFIDLWNYSMGSCGYQKQDICKNPDSSPNTSFIYYFKLDPNVPRITRLNTIADASEALASNFTRFILIEDLPATSDTEKKVTVIVRWTDTSGNHESNIQTILTRQ